MLQSSGRISTGSWIKDIFIQKPREWSLVASGKRGRLPLHELGGILRC
jgi:hypothetical protein